MTYYKDRELLLHQSGEDFHRFVRMVEFYYANPSQFYYAKRDRFLPRAVFLLIGFVFVLFLFDQYKSSMKSLESRECTDALSDCHTVPFNQTLLPAYYNYLQDFTITRRYDISLCLIPKVLSTIGTAALCYIEDPKAFRDSNRSITEEIYDARRCEHNEMKSFEMVKYNLNKRFDNIIVVRDPYERFISGFTEKCVRYVKGNHCHGCGTDIRCFLRKEYRRLMRISMLFPVYTLADTHFAPQTWFCNMKNTLKNSTIIRYSNVGEQREQMIDGFVDVFRKHDVPEDDIDEVRKELKKGKTLHSTAGTALRQEYETLIREDESIRRAIVRMYYYDFLLLGYPM